MKTMTNNETPDTSPADMAISRSWADQFLTNAGELPISFVLNGQAIKGIPATWNPVMNRRRIDANMTETVFEGTEPATGIQMRVEVTQYRDYPVVEWLAWLTNTGAAPTPLLQDIRALDAVFTGATPVVYHCNGDYYSVDGYTPQLSPVNAGDVLAYSPTGGRSCDGAFPYYRVQFEGWGMSIAIGWPAQWSVAFAGQADCVQIQASQETTHLALLPGESIRTPRMTVMSWAGDGSKAVNLWRRWYLAHILPRPNGQPMQPLLACAATDEGEEFTAATEENQVRYIEKFNQNGIHPDVWWIDAGWYPCTNKDHDRRWWITGTWEPDPERFPNGFKPISDCASQNGADLLVWFEPERVQPGTKLDAEHPEWLLRAKDSDNGLLNLGNPACRQWLTDHVCDLIQANGIKIYRQDHNFAPLAHWRENEATDRQGMNENLHVQGYLRFWDDLLLRNPGLWIDSCASGGRRNDLETMRRSVPLHYTDYGYGDHPVKLAFHHTLFEWIPYFKECTLSWDLTGNDRFDNKADSYSYHCGMAPMLFATLDIRREDNDYALIHKMIAIWRRAAGLMLFGDYYAHTPFHKDPAKWVAWQFDRPESRNGLVQGIRLPASPDETITIHLKGLRADANYVFENAETGEHRDITGETLIRDGFTFGVPPRNGVIWFYQRDHPVL